MPASDLSMEALSSGSPSVSQYDLEGYPYERSQGSHRGATLKEILTQDKKLALAVAFADLHHISDAPSSHLRGTSSDLQRQA